MTDRATDGLSFRSYLRVLTRWKWLIIIITVLVTSAGVVYTWAQTPMYSASAEMLFVKQIDISSPLSTTFTDATAQRAEIESVPTVIQSQQVSSSAEEKMDSSTQAAGYSVTAIIELGADGSTYSNVVTVNAVSADPAAAADAANAFAAAFIEWGRDSARTQVADAIEVVQSQLASYTTAEERASSEYAALKTSLGQLQVLEASASGDFKVITAASEPSEPYAPDKTRGAALALAAGFILGCALAFLFEQFDTRLHGDEQISEILDLPIIGRVPDLVGKTRVEGVLPTLTASSGRASEAYRLLRSNLEFVGFDGDANVLLISSSVQGEGKSVTSCNLAVTLALAGKKVALVDGDLRSPRVHAYLGVPNAVGVSSVLARLATLDEAISAVALEARARQGGGLVMTAKVAAGRAGTQAATGQGAVAAPVSTIWPDESGRAPVLSVLTSGPVPPNPGEMVASQRFGEIVDHLRGAVDVVLIDAPAMLPVGDTAAMARVVDGLVYVVNPSKVRRPDLHQARSQLGRLPCALLGIIEVADTKGQGYYYGYHVHSDDKDMRMASRRG